MKNALALCLLALFLLATPCLAAQEGTPTRIRILLPDGEVVVRMLDNPQARAFVAMLPLDVRLEDYAGEEKIFMLSKKLDTAGGQNADSIRGDFCYFAPWGNIAIFYEGFGHGKSLYVLGSMESGKERLPLQGKEFPARIERMK